MPFIPEMSEKSENYKFFELKEVKKGENNEWNIFYWDLAFNPCIHGFNWDDTGG
jgi:hypothetical protein